MWRRGGGRVWTVAAAIDGVPLYLASTAFSSPAFGPGLVLLPLRRRARADVADRDRRCSGADDGARRRALAPRAAAGGPARRGRPGPGRSCRARRRPSRPRPHADLRAAALVVLVASARGSESPRSSRDRAGRSTDAGDSGSRALTLACGASAAVGLTARRSAAAPARDRGRRRAAARARSLSAPGASRDRRAAAAAAAWSCSGPPAGLTAAARVVRRRPTAGHPATTPAEILTGAPLPRVPTAQRLLVGGQPDAVWVLIGAGLLVAYLGRVVRLRRAGTRWPARRAVLLEPRASSCSPGSPAAGPRLRAGPASARI